MQEFNKYYNNTLRNTLNVLEFNRLEKFRIYKLFLFGQILVVVVGFIIFMLWLVAFLNFQKFILYSCGLLVLFYFFNTQRKQIGGAYTASIKTPILTRILAKWGNFTSINPKKMRSARMYMNLLTGIKKNVKQIKINKKQCLTGKYNGLDVDFYFATNSLKKNLSIPIDDKSGDINPFIESFNKFCRGVKYNQTQHLVSLLVEYPKAFNGKIIFLQSDIKDTHINSFYHNLKRMDTSQFGFDNKYKVYTDNETEAAKLFGTDFSIFLSGQKEFFKKKLSLVIENNTVSMLLTSQNQFCYFNISEELDNSGKFLDIAEDIKFMFIIINIIKKNL